MPSVPIFSNYNEWARARQEAIQRGQPFTYDAPLGGVDVNQYKYGSFMYPMDLGAPGAGKDHYVVFHINETSSTQYQTRTSTGDRTGVNGRPTDTPTIVDNQTTDNARGIGISSPRNQVPNANSSLNQQPTAWDNIKVPIRRVATTIVLYLPEDIQTSYQADWDTVDMGAAMDIVNKARGVGSWNDVLKSLGSSALQNAGGMLNDITQQNLSGAVSSVSRLVVNPHMEVIFKGIGFRQFNFKFKLTPQSEEEALNIDNIVRAFKFYGAPEVLKGTAGRFWIYPAEFDIEYYSHGKPNEFLHKISTCALIDMNVNYTAAGQWSAHRKYGNGSIQGSPSVCTELSLQFKELEVMTKQRILEGY